MKLKVFSLRFCKFASSEKIKIKTLTLITSISGIRGTIGGKPGDGLTPDDIVQFTAAYAAWINYNSFSFNSKPRIPTIVIGRDARVSGHMVKNLVIGTLNAMGINVIDTDYSTTPTVEMAVVNLKADGGIILTASHNPEEWNALKLLNNKGEFISAQEGSDILSAACAKDYEYAEAFQVGKVTNDSSTIRKHIDAILELKEVDVDAIKNADFRVVVDAVNSTGGIAIPMLLDKLGVSDYKTINAMPTGVFYHDPEPLPENLEEIMSIMESEKRDVGIVVDPDVDRLAFIDENGNYFGEEYTLVAIADYWLSLHKGDTVSNLSSSRALRDITEKHGGRYHASAVGEVNVVAKMKEVNAVIGGEGNGGIILPALHYGRDALVGIALFLTYMAKTNQKVSEIKAKLPHYEMHKSKINIEKIGNPDVLLDALKAAYPKSQVDTKDGVKVYFDEDKAWVHIRKSNTEPILRLYAEAPNQELIQQYVDEVKKHLKVV